MGPTALEKGHVFDEATSAGRQPFKVKDLSLASFGRNEIRLAEQEMPGLMALRDAYAGESPLQGARVMGSLHMTVQTAVLIETLDLLGADYIRDIKPGELIVLDKNGFQTEQFVQEETPKRSVKFQTKPKRQFQSEARILFQSEGIISTRNVNVKAKRQS